MLTAEGLRRQGHTPADEVRRTDTIFRSSTSRSFWLVRWVLGDVAADLFQNPGGITRRLTHHTIAQMIGSSREMVARILKELVFGREAGATVKFDPDRDDVVGRMHARLALDPKDGLKFELVDLNSRNGIKVNGNRVMAKYLPDILSGVVVTIELAILIVITGLSGSGNGRVRFHLQKDMLRAKFGAKLSSTRWRWNCRSARATAVRSASARTCPPRGPRTARGRPSRAR